MASSMDVLDEQIAGILGARDVFDAAKFDPILHINAIFPNEQSFANADKILAKLRTKIKHLEKQIRDMLREQTDSEVDGERKELEDIKKLITKLYDDIKDIKDKAKHAETTVQDITKDIKSLDCAKRNLTTTITVLKRLQMLVSAVDQLRDVVARKKYPDIAILLQAVLELSLQFKTFRGIKQISDLQDQIMTIAADLKRMVFSDFEGSFSQQGVFTGNAATLHDACAVIEAMEPEVKKQLLDWYLDLQLREYRSIFRPNDEVGNLENLARRFAWLKRLCKTYDEEQAAMFPKNWNVSEIVCDRFCAYTRDDVTTLLVKTQNVDVKTLIKSLQMTLEFEQGLNRRFTTVQTDAKLPAFEASTQFTGKISASFEPFMRIYIEAEDRTLSDMIEKFRTTIAITEEDLNTGVFTGSTDLFYFYRQTLVSMAKLNTRKPFLDLSKLFQKWLVTFCDVLIAKIPREEKRAATTEEIRLASLILNTAEYCQNTTTQLEEKIKEKIDPEFKNEVDMTRERDMFLLLITNAVQILVRQVNSCLYVPMQSMTKIPWATLQTVGDRSEYIVSVNSALNSNVKVIRKLVSNAKHFKWFCDKFVDSFVPLFVKTIYSCKPISEVGAEQMLLDAHAVKTILLELPNVGAEEKQPPVATYVKFVTKGVAKAEFLLKVVLTPLEPSEMIIKNYMILSTEANGDADNKEPMTQQKITELRDGFIKILELKGVRKNDQQPLIDLLMTRIFAIAAPGASLNRTPISPIPVAPPPPVIQMSGAGLSSLASGLASISMTGGMTSSSQANAAASKNTTLSDAGVKLNENFKKFAAVMDIKSSWLKRDNNATNK